MISACFELNETSFECLELRSEQLNRIPYMHSCPEPKRHFIIINVGNDEKVLSAIKERSSNLNCDLILGLRDMYSEQYKMRANSIDDLINTQFIEATQNIINTFPNSDKIQFTFAIMEVEAWFLGMHQIFSRIHDDLNTGEINRLLGIDIENIDPEKTFFHPAQTLDRIFSLVKQSYSKSRDDVERITTALRKEDYDGFFESNKCSSFKHFAVNLAKM